MYWKSLKGSALLTLGFRGFYNSLMFISRRRDFYTNTYHSVKKNSLSFEHHSSKETWVENISYIFLEKIPIWPPMNPRWVRSETIFDDETLTTAEGNGMQWAGQWSGYYPPTLCKLCFGEIICQIFLCCGWSGYYPPTSYEIMQNKFLGELFVRFLKAMHNVTNQLWQFRSTLCKQNVWGSISFQTHQEKIHQTKTNDPIFQV